ncbi:hypothetical protein AA0313_0129 [Acetobacter indonesiensis NRIC 0313]|uniref:Uncharacterized protein n=1 Tax=Acetobacter indonesiensis TaxID=104101 RepID=A0A6N3T560_9PROT|nr:hypothetical protein Abin_060_061 [Acetobacter indonesiensis]GBQ53043.1 hypothetical protein AA0313_0129 [Acetobacter indonesiensis NRIC 0313]GEN03100.1 hypothetical protein AIN02nite_11250 [Acetobacter indonesiensis]
MPDKRMRFLVILSSFLLKHRLRIAHTNALSASKIPSWEVDAIRLILMGSASIMAKNGATGPARTKAIITRPKQIRPLIARHIYSVASGRIPNA